MPKKGKPTSPVHQAVDAQDRWSMASGKRPFDIHEAVERIAHAVGSLPKAALFELAEEGFSSLFELLIACIISIRTLDEVTLPCARRLLGLSRTPAGLSRIPLEKIDQAITPCTFHEAKARQIHDIAQHVASAFGDDLPCDETILRGYRGVGPKCANLALGIACRQSRISVDIHVHRVTNRWGYVQAATPEQTMVALETRLPHDYWIEINRLLVPFGKHICTGRLPRCSTCPVETMCLQVGVQSHR